MAKAMDSEVKEPRAGSDQCIKREKHEADAMSNDREKGISTVVRRGGATPLTEESQSGIEGMNSRTLVENEAGETAMTSSKWEETGGELVVATRILASDDDGEERPGDVAMGGDAQRKYSYCQRVPCGGESETGKGMQRTSQDTGGIFKNSKEACRKVPDLQPDNKGGGKARPSTNLSADTKTVSWATKVRNGTTLHLDRNAIVEKSPKRRVLVGEREKGATHSNAQSKRRGDCHWARGKRFEGRPEGRSKISDLNGLHTNTAMMSDNEKNIEEGNEATTKCQDAVTEYGMTNSGWTTVATRKDISDLLPQVHGISKVFLALNLLDGSELLPTLVEALDEAGTEGMIRPGAMGDVGADQVEAAETVAKAIQSIREAGLPWTTKDSISALSVAGADAEMRSRLYKKGTEGSMMMEMPGTGPIALDEAPFNGDNRFRSYVINFTGIVPTKTEAQESTMLAPGGGGCVMSVCE